MPLPHGTYTVLLKARDRAQNISVVSEQVAVRRNPPDMVLAATQKGQEMVVDLTSRSEVPVAFWRLEMRGDDGNIIKTAEGRELPAKVDVTMPDQTAAAPCSRQILRNGRTEYPARGARTTGC